MVGVFGASFGAVPVGIAIDYFGSPILTVRLLALYPILAAILAVMFLRAPKKLNEDIHLE